MKSIIIDHWDENFFLEFLELRNKIGSSNPTHFPETKDDFKKYFHPNSPFMADYSWCGFMVKDEHETVAQAILCWRKDSVKGNLGFLDWKNDEKAAEFLLGEVKRRSREMGLRSLKAPVDLSFFIKYRMRLPGGEAPLYGEPVYPDYYHDFLKRGGLTVMGEWDSYELSLFKALVDFWKKRRSLKKKRVSSSPQKLTIRNVKIKSWESELRVIHRLFIDAYQNMPEFEPLNFEQFRIIFDDFKYIAQPWLSYVLELDGKPVGFSINYVDPLPILSPLKGKALSLPRKLWLLLRLRLNRGTLMISHVGKVQGPEGDDFKGVQILASRRISFFSLFMKRVVVTFQNVNSPSRRAWNPEVQKIYARYVLYGMELE